MLEKFKDAKADEIAMLRRLDDEGNFPQPLDMELPGFSAALAAKGFAVIAEYKRASPSKGVINLGLEAADVARMYAEAGAACMSVLTEETYFQGDLKYLEDCAPSGLPLLRKDFLFDALQIRQTAATPASALLLIVRMHESVEEVRELLDLTRSLGMEAVVEAFDQRDVDIAQQAGATMIQINNRDLDTLTTDLNNSLELIKNKKKGELWISASGMSKPEDLQAVRNAGFDAVLIGTSLMQQGDHNDPAKALAYLLGEKS